MKRIIQIVFLSAFTFLFYSCKKYNSNQTTQGGTMVNSSFYYHRVISYLEPGSSKELLFPSNSDTNIVAVLNQNHLLLSFYTKPFSDDIIFEITGPNINSEIVGSYEVKTKNLSEGTVTANYLFNFYNLQGEQHSFDVVSSLFEGSGKLIISKYDKQQNTVSGSFLLNLDNVPDPTVDVTAQDYRVTRNCTVTLDGHFENILLH